MYKNVIDKGYAEIFYKMKSLVFSLNNLYMYIYIYIIIYTLYFIYSLCGFPLNKTDKIIVGCLDSQ